MSAQDLQNIRLSARIAALEGIVAGLLKRGTQPDNARLKAAQEIDHWVEQIRLADYPKDAEFRAAELRAAAESLGSFLKHHIWKD